MRKTILLLGFFLLCLNVGCEKTPTGGAEVIDIDWGQIVIVDSDSIRVVLSSTIIPYVSALVKIGIENKMSQSLFPAFPPDLDGNCAVVEIYDSEAGLVERKLHGAEWFRRNFASSIRPGEIVTEYEFVITLLTIPSYKGSMRFTVYLATEEEPNIVYKIWAEIKLNLD